ncbi:MAG: hypothetical protein ACK583_13790 [Cyanobacteriota bacterium]
MDADKAAKPSPPRPSIEQLPDPTDPLRIDQDLLLQLARATRHRRTVRPGGQSLHRVPHHRSRAVAPEHPGGLGRTARCAGDVPPPGSALRGLPGHQARQRGAVQLLRRQRPGTAVEGAWAGGVPSPHSAFRPQAVACGCPSPTA